MRRLLTLTAAVVMIWTLWTVTTSDSRALSRADVAAIRSAVDAYRLAWQSNQRDAVMRTLTEDAVLQPAHAQKPIMGREAIQRFWWPPNSPPTRVVGFHSTIDEVTGSGNMAFARGTFVLRFQFGTDPVRTNEGAYFMVLRRLGGDEWRITHRMWDDRITK